MIDLKKQVTDHLDQRGLRYQVIHDTPDLTVIHAIMSNADLSFSTFVRIDTPLCMIQCHSGFPVKIKPHLRPAVAETLHRANWGLRLGNFEMDYSDGEIRYHTALTVEDSLLSDAMLKHLFAANWSTMDRYASALMAVIYANKSPKGAIRESEQNKRRGAEHEDGEDLEDNSGLPPLPDSVKAELTKELMEQLFADGHDQEKDDVTDQRPEPQTNAGERPAEPPGDQNNGPDGISPSTAQDAA